MTDIYRCFNVSSRAGLMPFGWVVGEAAVGGTQRIRSEDRIRPTTLPVPPRTEWLSLDPLLFSNLGKVCGFWYGVFQTGGRGCFREAGSATDAG
jgi:hypothetical protein